jgi:hypothetical protein
MYFAVRGSLFTAHLVVAHDGARKLRHAANKNNLTDLIYFFIVSPIVFQKTIYLCFVSAFRILTAVKRPRSLDIDGIIFLL